MAIETAAACGTLAASSGSLGTAIFLLVVLVFFLAFEVYSVFTAVWKTCLYRVKVHSHRGGDKQSCPESQVLCSAPMMNVGSAVNRVH